MALRIHPVHATVGAEILGVDTSRPLDAGTICEIHKAIDQHAVVFFRDQRIADDEQMAFAKQFGELERYTVSYRKDAKLRLARPEMVDISNVDAATGMAQARNARRRMLNMAARIWHADSSFRLPVGALSMLYAHQIPPTGGETEFADMRAAYDELPEDRKLEIDGLMLEHSMVHGYKTVLGFADFEQTEVDVLPPVAQPLVRIHSRTGRKALYLGWSALRVLGMDVPDGRILIYELTEHATQRHFVYSHTWQIGDLVIWDNRSVMHRGRRYDESYVRDMRRVTTADTQA